MIAPCVDVLRHLSRMMHNILGSDQGTKHEPPNLKNDIQDLMRSLTDHGVYTLNVGRTLDDDDPPVKDVITTGLQQLTDNSPNPLDEYNEAFKQLQARRRLRAVVGEAVPNPEEEPIESMFINNTTPPLATGLPMATPSSVSAPGDEGYESGEEEEDDDVGEGEEGMDDTEEAEPTLRRETAEDVSLDMVADGYPDEDADEGGDDSDSDDAFGLGEGIWHGDEEIDMNIVL
jgi:hypothetical protein